MTGNAFTLFATPWWVNLLIIVPVIFYLFWRKRGVAIARRILFAAFVFAAAFGFVEAAVVVYFRAALGLLPGMAGTLADIARLSSSAYNQALAISNFPPSLLSMELFREAATIVILITISLLSARTTRERLAVFLWTFAAWDIFYYVWLWVTVRWPLSLLTPDTLFLIPVPWISQVWYPLLVSVLMMSAVLFSLRRDY